MWDKGICNSILNIDTLTTLSTHIDMVSIRQCELYSYRLLIHI